VSHYTYLWLRKDLTPYYAGKGAGYRAYTRTRHGIRRPTDRWRIIVFPHDSERDALEHEKFMIVIFGRKDNGTGCLRNYTDGGEGVSNPSVETRNKMRQAKLGTTASALTRLRMSMARKGVPQLKHRGLRWRHSEEAKEKIRKATMGNKRGLGHVVTEEARNRIISKQAGRPLTLEHRQKLSEAAKKRAATKEGKENCSRAGKLGSAARWGTGR
jgi:hypothetical protein